jgi:hypothetical protein
MRRQAPEVHWRAVLLGGLAAVLATIAVSFLASAVRSDLLLLAATPIGLATGGAAAGRISGTFGLLQGGMVGILWVLAEALAETFGSPTGDVLADVALILLADGGRILLAGAFGWLGARSVRPSS